MSQQFFPEPGCLISIKCSARIPTAGLHKVGGESKQDIDSGSASRSDFTKCCIQSPRILNSTNRIILPEILRQEWTYITVLPYLFAKGLLGLPFAVRLEFENRWSTAEKPEKKAGVSTTGFPSMFQENRTLPSLRVKGSREELVKRLSPKQRSHMLDF